ncbi:MAG: hypothetical protein GF308_13600 [Candidatus Heimdallarchaeota archaeon]|nr:hypothetical protein [Candidatus Heimdallarchaeota archaeon]
MNIKEYRKMLKSKDKKTRQKAVDNLALSQDEEATEALITILEHDPEGSVRRRAALALGRIGCEVALESLCQVMKNDPDEETRKNAAISVGKFGDFRAIPVLFDFYSAPRQNNFFDNIDRARVNLVLTELAQTKGFKTIEELVEWYESEH